MVSLPNIETLKEQADTGLRAASVAAEATPVFKGTKFRCPRCKVVAAQTWIDVYHKAFRKGRSGYSNVETQLTDLGLSSCASCQGRSLWFEAQLLYPIQSVDHPMPEDMPPEFRRDYEEAATISFASPRAAAALLRMCIEGLCKKASGKTNFDDAIRQLELQGIPSQIAMAMDVVRANGNEALHAGKLYGSDDATTVALLFRVAHSIVTWAITEKRELAQLYEAIPLEKRERLEKLREKHSRKEGPAKASSDV